MQFLSEDDLDLKNMSDEELANAWWLWFTLAQNTNDSDPPFSHGCLAGIGWKEIEEMVGVDAAIDLRRSTPLRNG